MHGMDVRGARDNDLWGSLFARPGCSGWPGGASRPGQWFISLSGKNFPSISACRHIGWGLKFLFGQKSPSKSGLSSNPLVLESLSGKNFPSIPGCRLIRWCMKCLTGHKLSIQIQTSIKSDGEQVFKTPNWAPSKSGLKPNPMVSKPQAPICSPSKSQL